MAGETTHGAPPPKQTPIRSVLATPGLARLLIAAVISRLPFAAASILLLLRARDLGASYPTAGLIVGIGSVAAGLSEPVLARLTDRVGQSSVLAFTVPANLLSFAAAAAIPSSWPLWSLALAGAAMSASYAQVGGMLRALLVEMLDDEHARHAAFALDGAAAELQLVVGPVLLVTAIAGIAGPSAGLAVGGAISAAGTTVFALSPASRRWRPADRPDGTARDRLATSPFVLLVALMLVMGIGFGALEVGATAFADHHGHRSLVGLLLALSAVGSVVGAAISASVGMGRNPAARLSGLVAFQALTIALLGLARSLPVMGAFIAINGLAIAPAIATVYGFAAVAIPSSRVTEGYGWLGLAINAGASLGAVLAGALTTDTSTAAAFVVPAALLGAGCVAAIRPLRRQRLPVRGTSA